MDDEDEEVLVVSDDDFEEMWDEPCDGAIRK